MTAGTIQQDKPEILGILFDKDGTLLDYDASWAPVNRQLALMAAKGNATLANALLSACGMNPDTGVVMADSLLAAGNSRQIAQGLVDAGAEFDVQDLTIELDQIFAAAADFSVPVTDLNHFFAQLKQKGLKLGIASSDNERSIRAIVQRFGLTDHVDYICGYDSGHGCKPEPGMVYGFCQATGLSAAQVAVVGDNNHDLHMGRNAGAGLTIAVLTGTGSRETLTANSDFCLNNITELNTVLN
jgi:phosphoglycolate phosphatase